MMEGVHRRLEISSVLFGFTFILYPVFAAAIGEPTKSMVLIAYVGFMLVLSVAFGELLLWSAENTNGAIAALIDAHRSDNDDQGEDESDTSEPSVFTTRTARIIGTTNGDRYVAYSDRNDFRGDQYQIILPIESDKEVPRTVWEFAHENIFGDGGGEA